jgi:tryptophanyl-tRNA synthetase
MRPTGRLHLGHYFGALSNWLKLQEEFDCFFFVADWHALTTHYEDTSSIAENTLQVAIDWLSIGLDPKKSTLFIQSQILEHAELHLLLSMITPLSWLERVPTYKEQIENLKDRDLGTYGFLGYPLLQSADIVMYGESKQELLVPVGEDQAPHVEMTREVVRRFNHQFGFSISEKLNASTNQALRFLVNGVVNTGAFLNAAVMPDYAWKNWSGQLRKITREIGFENAVQELPKDARKYYKLDRLLAEPDVILTDTPRLPGLDGRRMAKSYGNAIWLSDPPDEIRAKVRNMMTDPQRVRRTDPGRPEVCPVFAYHKLFSPPITQEKIDRDCRSAAIGCVDCKKLMAESLVTWIEPIQAQRQKYEANPKAVWDILDAGSSRARKTAKRTMKRVRDAIFKWDEARKSSSGVAAPATATKEGN